MRYPLWAAVRALFFFATVTVAQASQLSLEAPADEYFGRFKQSILEINNRLNALDYRDARSMRSPTVARALDSLQEAIGDWQRKYPHDPWLPRYWRHLMREYARARAASSSHARAAARLMHAYRPK